MRLLTTIILISICLTAFGQTTTARNWIDTEVTYSDSIGNALSITNSLPKGGATYTDPARNTYSYVVFWYRVTNESEVPLELELKFPAKPFEIFPSDDSHIRIFSPPETMTSEKIALHDYGLSDLKGFLDAEFNEPSMLEKTINPKEEYFFYTSILIHQARGTARTSLVMKGQDLFYQIKIGSDSALIPCGWITFKN